MEYRRIGLYGISSTGKTTVAKLVEKLHPQYKFIDGSDVFNEVCPGGLTTFKNLSFDEKTKYRILAIEYLLELQSKINKHLVIAGHYSFICKKGDFEIAWTKADDHFYTDIFLFSDTPESIYSRNKLRNINYSLEQITVWQEFEINSIKNLSNQNIYINSQNSINDTAIFVLKSINKSIALKVIENIINSESYQTYLLIDADGTLIPYDSAEIVSKYIHNCSPATIKQIFKKYNDYCYEAFLEVADYYSTQNDYDSWIKAMLKATEEIHIYSDFVNILKNDKVGKFIVSAGFSELWKNIVSKYLLKNVHVISGNSSFDNYIITDELKGKIAQFLKSNNKNVISFGDSLVDRFMLLNSDLGIYIIHNQIKSVYPHLIEKENIKYITFDDNIKPSNICKTSINEIQQIIN